MTFIAGTVPLYGISRLSIHLLVTGLENHVPHIAKSALYYIVGIRVSELPLSWSSAGERWPTASEQTQLTR